VAEVQQGDERVSLTTTAVKGFAWQIASFGGNRIVVFVMTLVLARLLTPHDFGVFAAALTFMMYLEVVLDLGVGSAVIFEQESGLSERLNTAFTINVSMSIVFTAVAILIAPWVASVLGVPDQVAIFRVMSLYLIARGLSQINEAVLQRDLMFKKKTIVDLSGALVRGGLSVGLAVAGFGVWSIVWGFLGGEFVSAVLAWIMVRFRPHIRLDRAAARSMLKFGAGIVTLDIISELALNSDYIVIANVLGATVLGLYTIAYKLPDLLIGSVFWMFSSVAFPVYSRSRGAGMETLRAGMLKALRLTSLFGFAVGMGLAIISRDAVVVLFSEKWHPAIAPMAVLSLAAGLGAVGYASGDIFPAVGRPGALVAINLPLTIARVVGFIIAAPHGILAVAWVHLVSNFVYVFVRIEVANRFVGSRLGESLAALWPAVCAAAGIAVFAIPVRIATSPSVGSLVAICAAGVLGAVVFLWIGSRDTFGEISDVMHRLLERRAPAAVGAGAVD
jgi:PST family polysaccharide transporter